MKLFQLNRKYMNLVLFASVSLSSYAAPIGSGDQIVGAVIDVIYDPGDISVMRAAHDYANACNVRKVDHDVSSLVGTGFATSNLFETLDECEKRSAGFLVSSEGGLVDQNYDAAEKAAKGHCQAQNPPEILAFGKESLEFKTCEVSILNNLGWTNRIGSCSLYETSCSRKDLLSDYELVLVRKSDKKKIFGTTIVEISKFKTLSSCEKIQLGGFKGQGTE